MRAFVLPALIFSLSLCAGAQQSFMRPTDHPTALDSYVAAPDDAYKFELVNSTEREDWSSYVLKLTSQRWLTEAEVDRPLWEHWLTIVVPKEVKHDTAFLYIGGGSNKKTEAPKGPGVIVRRVALATNSVAVELGMVPNQPLTFTDEPGRGRSEDSLIAYTWDKFMRTGDPKWPLRLPMTKSAVRAMDAVQEFLASRPEPVDIDHFVVGGGSKRGWTTWTTGIVDSRVRAIVPIVINMLNVIPSFRHHYAALGFWAPAVNDYVKMDIMNRMETAEYAELMKIEEPFSYLDRLNMPKFVINAGSDEFFLPDSTQFYWDQLPDSKRLRNIPNTGHGLGGSDVLDSVVGYYDLILKGAPLPEYSWSFPDAQTIEARSETAPKAALLWQVTNENARDFRLDQVGQTWTSTAIEPNADGVYVGRVEAPEKGWRAYMIEFTYETPGGTDLKFTTPVRVFPDTLPHEYKPVEEPVKGYLSAN